MQPPKTKQCFFCTSNRKRFVDYKDAETLRRFMAASMKVMPRRRSNLCASHQRDLANAVKRARFLGLVPYTLH